MYSRPAHDTHTTHHQKRKTQATLDAKERETNFLRREVERVTGERDALHASVSGDKAYIRRLEHKLAAGGPDNAERCTALRRRVKELKDALDASSSKLAAAAHDFQNAMKDKVGLYSCCSIQLTHRV
jgi:predicted  nucleic acid-binding Zn-ribbon protein